MNVKVVHHQQVPHGICPFGYLYCFSWLCFSVRVSSSTQKNERGAHSTTGDDKQS